MDYRAPVFNEPDGVLRGTTIAEIVPGLDTPEGFRRGIRWAWLQLTDEQRMAHPNIERYEVTRDFLKGFQEISRGKPHAEWENHLRNTAHIIADIACVEQNCITTYGRQNLKKIIANKKEFWRFRFNGRGSGDRGHYRENPDGTITLYAAGDHGLENVSYT
jgi:hypothetical protein